jgi:16S rRNA (guanine1207-N2)-methyltransferase
VERSSQLVLRNEARLLGGLLLVNPPRDALFRQLQNERRSVRISTQDHGDHRWLSRSGARVSFDVLPEPGEPTRTVILNLPREKDRLVMMLHAISSWMPDDTRMWLVGENKSGIKSARRYLERFFRHAAKLDSARHCVLFQATEPKNERPFDLNEYEVNWPVDFAGHRVEVVSLPGVFAHGRLDKGTGLLLKSLERLRPDGKILDFACGSGVIGCSLLTQNANADLTLLDVSSLALEASRRSLCLNGLKATLLPSDGLSELSGRYDWIVSNPPFHRGVSNDPEIARRFFRTAGTFLTENGRIAIVCNRHLPYANWLREHFDKVETLDANNEFMIVQAGKPRNHQEKTQWRQQIGKR